jgi:hypothetical protein
MCKREPKFTECSFAIGVELTAKTLDKAPPISASTTLFIAGKKAMHKRTLDRPQ